MRAKPCSPLINCTGYHFVCAKFEMDTRCDHSFQTGYQESAHRFPEVLYCHAHSSDVHEARRPVRVDLLLIAARHAGHDGHDGKCLIVLLARFVKFLGPVREGRPEHQNISRNQHTDRVKGTHVSYDDMRYTLTCG